MRDEREEVARLIDPGAWRGFKIFCADKGVELYGSREKALEASIFTKPSLAKADAIIALLSRPVPVGLGGDEEGGVSVAQSAATRDPTRAAGEAEPSAVLRMRQLEGALRLYAEHGGNLLTRENSLSCANDLDAVLVGRAELLEALKAVHAPYRTLTDEALEAGILMEFGPPKPERGAALLLARAAISKATGAPK